MRFRIREAFCEALSFSLCEVALRCGLPRKFASCRGQPTAVHYLAPCASRDYGVIFGAHLPKSQRS